MLFLLRYVNSAALPLVRCYTWFAFPNGIASWVTYSGKLTESSSEYYDSDLGLLKAVALWCEHNGTRIQTHEPMNPWTHETHSDSNLWIRKRVFYQLYHNAPQSVGK